MPDGDHSSWLQKLLGLHQIDPGDAHVMLGWRYDLPLWAWLFVLAATLAVGTISYQKMLGRRAGRVTLGLVRAAIVLVLALLLAGPMLVLPREHIEADHVLMLVDRSESMSVRDVPGGPEGRTSRDEQLRDALGRQSGLWDQLSREHRLDWLGFSDRPLPIGSLTDLPEPGGRTTAMRTAIDEALRRTAGKPVSALVILSDGRSGEPVGADVISRLQRLDVPVFTVPLGSAEPMLDLAIERVDAPDRAFVKDMVPVTVTIGRTGEGGDEPLPPDTLVKLVDTTTGQTLDEQPVEKVGQPVRLLHTPKAAGRATWEVRLSTPQAELSQANNLQSLDIAFEDRPIRVLYVEGYPRWEYRYLKTLLEREDSIASSIMLLSADRSFAQEGDIPLRRLPQTAEEIRPFDVVILGDAPADYFTAEQFRLIHEQVSIGGAGLMLIGGPDQMPASYLISPLATLLPIAGSPSMSLLQSPIVLRPTPQARALGVLFLRSPQQPDDPSGWPSGLPALMWAQAIGGLKPATEVLATDEASGNPLIALMRFGAGQSLYLATDESWRWRKPWGELYVDQYWTQLLRLLARGRLESAGDDRARLGVSHRRAATGDTLTVDLTIRDQTLLDPSIASVDVAITEVLDSTTGGPRGRAARREIITLAGTDQPGLYRGVWTPRTPGKMSVVPATQSLADLGLERIVEVADTDSEMRYPVTDHPLLAQLAQQTGGASLGTDDLPQLATRIKNRARITTADITEPLTRSPLAFATLLLLLTVEWVGRKFLGLA